MKTKNGFKIDTPEMAAAYMKGELRKLRKERDALLERVKSLEHAFEVEKKNYDELMVVRQKCGERVKELEREVVHQKSISNLYKAEADSAASTAVDSFGVVAKLAERISKLHAALEALCVNWEQYCNGNVVEFDPDYPEILERQRLHEKAREALDEDEK